jgi:hypothetical protein
VLYGPWIYAATILSHLQRRPYPQDSLHSSVNIAAREILRGRIAARELPEKKIAKNIGSKMTYPHSESKCLENGLASPET